MDLVLKGGRVIDPSQKLDEVCDIGFAEGKVAEIGTGLKGTRVHELPGRIVTPGLIDLHTHVYWGGTSLGIEAEDYARRCGVTTAVDTGSAGPGNFAGFRAHVIDHSAVRILAYLHVSFAGIYGFDREIAVGESEDLRLMAPHQAARVAEANRDVIVGIKVRLGRHASGDQGLTPLAYAMDVAEETGLPVMAHIDEPPPSYGALVEALRTGDVLTHCFRPFPNAPCIGQGAIRPEVIEARRRGVIFDIGHGMGSFSFKTARMMLAQDFPPDT
ncbi:MAG: amidohydrolase family protein, partial [Pseudomonadota bacterium]